ncbi:MAG: Pilin bioproteinis protein [Parcubacteria group bacterium Gr01-1014_70]|nr:MAG: Pilin bioproteinis protein [Parcubacteria group bacterium Gr01-1014_70]
MLYVFKAKKLTGEVLESERDAANKRELSRLLRQDGYMLIAATEKGEVAAKGLRVALPTSAYFMRMFGRVSLAEKLMFTRNLGVMIGAGLALTRALETLERQTKSNSFKTVIHDVVEHISKGETFSESISKHPRVFSKLFVAMISAGESSGKLDEALTILASQLKNEHELRSKVRGALIYPSVIMCVMILIGILMLVYVVPTLTSVFTEMKIELPASTRVVIAISGFLLAHGVLSFGAFVAGIYGIILFMRTDIAKRGLDVVVIKMPLIGPLAKEVNSARTARTMSSLIQSGVSIVETLTITRDVLQNHLFQNILDEAREGIQKGETMTLAFGRHPELFPVLVSEMIAVGEETGKTAEMLERLAEFYEGEVAAATKDLSSIVEPFLMVLIGAFVGLFAVSMIQPLYTSIATGF